jgi:sensor histidine kinase YesM
MKQQRSAKTLLTSILYGLLASTVLCFAFCGGYALYTSQQELMRYNRASLDVYLGTLIHSMEDLQKFNEDIFTDNLDFLALSKENGFVSIPEKMQHIWNLRQLIQDRTRENCGILLFGGEPEENYYCFGEGFLGGNVTPETVREMQSIRAFWVAEDAPATQCWVSYSSENSTLLLHAFRRENLYICAMVDVEAYAQTYSEEAQLGDVTLAFLTGNSVLTNVSDVEQRGISLEEMLAATGRPVFDGRTSILQTRFDQVMGVGICGMISLSGVWVHLRVYILMLAFSLFVICALFIGMYQLLKRLLVFPLDQITNATRQIAKGDSSIPTQAEPIRELAQIQDALVRLIEQKVSLQRDNDNQVFEKEHALLQYYQLQTRSHFILNCLKSIYSLTMQGDQEKTMRMIGLFSNHLRYIYHDSLSWVTIQAELEEVQNYFGIIEQGRTTPILLNQSTDPDLLEFLVPPLIIQTFLENSNKYNAQDGQILRFGIRIDKVRLEEREYVRIRMTDNGVGYSEEALQGLQTQNDVFGQQHVGIQNLCRRMDILYRKQYKKAFLNNPGGGALSIFYLPLEVDGGKDA